MACILLDSFDHYATSDIVAKWTQVENIVQFSVIAAVGRRGTNGLQMGASAIGVSPPTRVRITPYMPLPSGPTCICGFAFRHVPPFLTSGSGSDEDPTSFTGNAGSCVFAVRQGGATQIWFRIRGDGTIEAMKGTSHLGGSAIPIQQNVYAYLEFKVVLHASAGTIEVRKNGAPILTLASLNTIATGNAFWNEIKLGELWTGGNAPNGGNYDDLYLLDGTGAFNNDFWGDTRIDAIYPNEAGSASQFTRFPVSVTDQWATIDETTPNGDSDYNETQTVGNRDSLNFPNVPAGAGANVLAVQSVGYVRKNDAGSAGLKFGTRMGGVYYDGIEIPVPATYNYLRQIWDRRPTDSGMWIDTDVNAAEFGYLKSS